MENSKAIVDVKAMSEMMMKRWSDKLTESDRQFITSEVDAFMKRTSGIAPNTVIINTIPAIHPTHPAHQKKPKALPHSTNDDIKLVMAQTGCTREEATDALNLHKSDILSAILHITK